MRVAGFSAEDGRLVKRQVGRALRSAGLPRGCISRLVKADATCGTHADSLRADVRLPDGAIVEVASCGCGAPGGPTDAPDGDLTALAHGLTAEIVSYRRSHAETLARVAEITEACEREAAKARSLGIDAELVEVRSPELDTVRGPRPCIKVQFDLIHDHLLPQRWQQAFLEPADVTKFFRAMRPYLLALSERRDVLAALGARAAIDSVAVAALRAAGIDPLNVVADMARDSTSRRIAVGGVDLLLYWRMKTIRGEIDVAHGVRWEFGRIRFAMKLKEALERLGNGVLGSMVASPLLPGHVRVRCSHFGFEETVLVIDPKCELFDVRDGAAMWVTADAAKGSSTAEPEAAVRATGPDPASTPASFDQKPKEDPAT